MLETIISVKNDLDQLSVIVKKLEQFATYWNLDDLALFNINLVIEEIFTNIVFYAFPDNNEHIIILRLSKKNNKVIIKIEDDGKEFDPTEAPEPEHIDKPLEEREVGGLGIHFVNTIMPDPSYQRTDNKNILTLTYKIV